MVIPTTVPNSPMNGATLATVARNGTRFSSLLISTVAARNNARSTAARLLRVGRGAGPDGLAGCAPVILNCAFSSAYPAWNTPTRGLAGSVEHTAWTSENLLLLRNASRNLAVCPSTFRYDQLFDRMMA